MEFVILLSDENGQFSPIGQILVSHFYAIVVKFHICLAQPSQRVHMGTIGTHEKGSVNEPWSLSLDDLDII